MKEIFIEAKSYLNETFEHVVTDFLLENQIKTKSEDEVYFCDFIGQDDTNILGHKEPTDDDCLFTTAQAINILVATWTVHHKNSNKLEWKTTTPKYVEILMSQSTKWLQKNVLNSKLKAMNAFFSGSVKGTTSLPFYYPVNIIQYVNGTYPNPDKVPQKDFSMLINGVKGNFIFF